MLHKEKHKNMNVMFVWKMQKVSHCCRDCVTANSFGQVQKEMEFDKGSGTKCAGSEFWRFG